MKKRNLIITFLALVMLVSTLTVTFANDKDGDKTVKPKVEKVFFVYIKTKKIPLLK
ncbi:MULTISPECIES: hypothetical protein [Bacillus]|uniref:hypothetical protein n=1 Tax=Bacillus TaxID=1386 RepID=UPI0020CD41D9|nr:hypothetical protein [Bacillus safensis]MCP9283682.1 hypothetical protein [Bacillus safensis]